MMETKPLVGFVQTDTVRGFRAARDFSFNASLNTRLYGMYQIKKGPVAAIRHVVTPNVSFNFRPDFGSEFWNYWGEYQSNADGDTRRYSYFEGLLYGGPPDGRSGAISFSLSNNLEMKVRSKKDTISGLKKLVLIDNFSINTSYDIAKDSLNWSPLTLSGRTTLFKKLNINYSSTWDPYAVDSAGNVVNKFQWDVDKTLFRKTAATWNFGLNFRISSADFKKGKQPDEDVQPDLPLTSDPLYDERYNEMMLDNPSYYIDWNNPWSLSINYNLRINDNPRYYDFQRDDTITVTQTIGVSGDISITPKWKVNFGTGYDFKENKLTYTSIDFYRDLHCWEMFFGWIPSGARKSWQFGINVKSSILRDLKYERKKDFRDAYR